MTPEKILEDTGRSFTIWRDGRIEVGGEGGVVRLKLSPSDCGRIAKLLMDVADGEMDSWPVDPERINWLRTVKAEQD